MYPGYRLQFVIGLSQTPRSRQRQDREPREALGWKERAVFHSAWPLLAHYGSKAFAGEGDKRPRSHGILAPWQKPGDRWTNVRSAHSEASRGGSIARAEQERLAPSGSVMPT